MSNFEPITTQEQLDEIIGSRIKRAEESAKKDIEKIKAENEELIKSLDSTTKELEAKSKLIDEEQVKAKERDEQFSEMTEKLQKYENDSVKTRVAHEMHLPFESIKFISGNTEEEIRKSAEELGTMFVKQQPAPVNQIDKPDSKQTVDMAFAELSKDLGGKK